MLISLRQIAIQEMETAVLADGGSSVESARQWAERLGDRHNTVLGVCRWSTPAHRVQDFRVQCLSSRSLMSLLVHVGHRFRFLGPLHRRSLHLDRPLLPDPRWPGWGVVVGIEVHAQIKSRQKLFSCQCFSGCSTLAKTCNSDLL